jgi:hypothetical protein
MALFQINPTNKRLGNDELEKFDTVQKEDIFLYSKCKRRGRINGGSQSVFARSDVPASNEMSSYKGCTKEE